MKYPHISWDGRGELIDWLKANDLNPKKTPKGYSVRCLTTTHNDHNNSAQVFTDNLWWICYACGARYPLINDSKIPMYNTKVAKSTDTFSSNKQTMDFYDYWLDLEPVDVPIKGLPHTLLNSLGWRKFPKDNPFKLPEGIFIPAFDMNRATIPFFQVRHPKGAPRRFSFPTGVQQIPFGFEYLDKTKTFVCFTEGNSDRATLEMIGVHAIAIPSANAQALMKALANWVSENGRMLVACCDSDRPGEALIKDLQDYAFIDMRPATKDVNEMFNIDGIDKLNEKYKWLHS